MPVAQKTSRQRKTRSKRKPTTITMGVQPRSATRRRRSEAVAKPVRKAAPSRKRKSGKDHGALPSWRQLESKKNRRLKQDPTSPFLDAISTARFALLLAAVAAAFTLYVGHVHATQDLLARTEQVQKENHRLHLKYNRLKGDFDRMTGPAEIHRRARALGLVEDTEFGNTIVIDS